MFCKECGHEISDNAVICPKCGVKVKTLGESIINSAKKGIDKAKELSEKALDNENIKKGIEKTKEFTGQVLTNDNKSSSEGKSENSSNTSGEEKPVQNEKEKPSYLWFAFNSAIFGYNCYAITNNLCVKDGYIYVVFGLLVNIVILAVYASQFKSLFPKLNKNLAYILLAVICCIGIVSGYKSSVAIMEEAAVGMVTKILKDQNHLPLECKAVKIDKKVTDNFYKATATLDTGDEIRITIERKDNNMILVTVPPQ